MVSHTETIVKKDDLHECIPWPAVNEVQMRRESPDNFQDYYHIDENSMQSFVEPIQLCISNNLAAKGLLKGDGPILEFSNQFRRSSREYSTP